MARRAARELVAEFAAYAGEHPGEPVSLGIFEFSRRDNQPDCRPIIPMGPPDISQADAALSRLDPEGGTPIGQAMVAAKLALDGTGLSRRHLLIVSDGENTDGFRPEDVAAAIAKRPDAERPSIYFVAFNIEARSPETQLVKNDVLKGSPLEGLVANFGQWIWTVTPKVRGSHPLELNISASVRDARGLPASATLPNQTIPIEVAISLTVTSRRLLWWILSAGVSGAATTLVGVITRDYWWPVLKSWLSLP